MNAAPPTTTAPPAVISGQHPPRALVVEDDPAVADFLVQNLRADRFDVAHVACGADAIAMLSEYQPDVMLLDDGLPDASGLDIIARVRGAGPLDSWDARTAVIMLTARNDAQSIVRGLQRGADDYVVKPFHYAELLERMRASLRRSRSFVPMWIHVGPLAIDRAALVARVGQTSLDLTSKEFSLLVMLAAEPTRAVAKEELLRDIWGYGHVAQRTRTLDTHASRLRRKLQEAGMPGCVRSVWGFGYRLLPIEG